MNDCFCFEKYLPPHLKMFILFCNLFYPLNKLYENSSRMISVRFFHEGHKYAFDTLFLRTLASFCGLSVYLARMLRKRTVLREDDAMWNL